MATKPALTWEDFLAAGKEGQRWEYVDGEVKFMSPHIISQKHGSRMFTEGETAVIEELPGVGLNLFPVKDRN